MKKSIPTWETYERLVARLISNQLSTAYTVTPNVRLTGKLSLRKRQIDVLIENRQRAERYERVIIDAKLRKRAIDVTHVEAFKGLMEDVGATHGYLICSAGYTRAAERRAQDSISVRLLPLDRMENFDPATWPKCLQPKCDKGKVFWDGYPVVDAKLLSITGKNNPPQTLSYIHYVGKCDYCGIFHVKCLSCSDFFSINHLSDNEGYQCKCNRPWFWLSSVEVDKKSNKFSELHFVSNFTITTINRLSL